jgi:hypothetical protein
LVSYGDFSDGISDLILPYMFYFYFYGMRVFYGIVVFGLLVVYLASVEFSITLVLTTYLQKILLISQGKYV